MRRLLVILALIGAAIFVFAGRSSGSDGTSDGSGTYYVNVIFDNAAAASLGEDVKTSGAKIGTIHKFDVTKDRKAIVTLKIDDSRFTPFHADAHCSLRPEGVLAVKYIDCDPGSSTAPRLQKGPSGYDLLPVTGTSSPIDSDLVSNIMRNPTGQEFGLVLAEFGTGLAGRGRELNAVIHRANPALGETDEVLKILARQSAELKQFSADAEQILHPLARDKDTIAGFIHNASKAAQPSAARSAELQASIRKLPEFLASLRDQMVDVQALTAQGVPFLDSLGPAAPAVSRATEALGPFAQRATPAFVALGNNAQRSDPLLQKTRPLIDRLAKVGHDLAQPAKNLDALLVDFDKQLGFQHLMDIIYGAANATSGFDSVGHYARAEPLSGACSEYTAKGFFGCDAQWGPSAETNKPIYSNGKPAPSYTRRSATTSNSGTSTTDTTATAEPVLDYLLKP